MLGCENAAIFYHTLVVEYRLDGLRTYPKTPKSLWSVLGAIGFWDRSLGRTQCA